MKLTNYLLVKTFEDYQKSLPTEHKHGHVFNKKISIAELKKQLDRIKGHLVWMQLDFLCDAEMAEKGLQINYWTESVYT
jgi:phospholipase D1/2